MSVQNHHPNVYAAVISLRRATARRRAVTRELLAAGVSAVFVDAIDVRQVDEGELRKRCRDEGPWGVFTLQNMACTLSHAQIWQKFLDTDAEFALILEDDVFVATDLGSWLSDTGWWPKGADVVKFERWRSDGLYVLLDGRAVCHRGRTIRRMYSRHSGSAGYMLTRAAAKAFLAREPFDVSIDQLLFNAAASPAARNMSIHQVQPAMIEQGNDPDPGQAQGLHRPRPTGRALWRQKIRRGLNELRFPPHVIARVLSGRARPTLIRFDPASPSGAAQGEQIAT
ncbi:glycosyltransferase family 25 protein [Sedimentitalea sp. HM32M-2]|uniref:glycosyltransferase family 25 protein n=1 Tax=Sedimentitalea sp. HM32M-2 TaxID=3351566 RepID=UPI003632DD79